MRWITQFWAVALAALPPSQRLMRRQMLASGAAGIAALAGRNPNQIYRSVLSPPAADTPPARRHGATLAAPLEL